jgi:sulfur relay protein TusB/DsrH
MTGELLQTSLHTLNKTASEYALNKQLSQCMQKGDSILLLENGVYQSISLDQSPSNKHITLSDNEADAHWSEKAACIYVLSPDALARGIQTDSVYNDKVKFIDYTDFVELTMHHKKVISWY